MEDGLHTKLDDLPYGDMLKMANELSQKGQAGAAVAIILRMIEKWPDRVFNQRNSVVKKDGGDL